MLYQLLGIAAAAIFGKYTQAMENEHLIIFRIGQPAYCVIRRTAIVIHDICGNDLPIFNADTGLVVIDTLQRVRGSGDNGNPYANDYRDIGTLKALADKHRIAILLIHHVRKLRSDDPMDMISGTNGISGATDTNFVLMKTSRSENTATLYCTGRDIVYRELRLEFDSETHLWNLLSDDCPQTMQPDARLLSLLSEVLRQQPAISVPAATLLKIIDPDDVERLTPNLLSRRIRKNVDTLGKNGIMVSFRKSNGERLICLRSADRDANITTANTVPIDPVGGAN